MKTPQLSKTQLVYMESRTLLVEDNSLGAVEEDLLL